MMVGWLLITALVITIQTVQALFYCGKAHKLDLENIKLRAKLQEPNWYCDSECDEAGGETIKNAVCEYDIGEVAKLRPIHYLPHIWVLHDDTGNEVFNNKNDANKAAEKWSAK